MKSEFAQYTSFGSRSRYVIDGRQIEERGPSITKH